MTKLPRLIETEAQLDDVLSLPSENLIACVKRISGDFMVLGAGGKVGPTLTRTLKRAVDAAGVKKTITAVDVVPMPALEAMGVKTLACDMLDPAAVDRLPRIENVIYMVGRKFGSTGQEHLTWAINVIVASHVARTFKASRIAAFSTGCVYPVMDLCTGGATEAIPADPVGEYAMSCLGRERMFDYYAVSSKARVTHIRLNYALELRYGVLADVAGRVARGEPVDLTTGFANGIWQGDACNQAIQSVELAASPATILNVTGPETFSIRQVAQEFGRLLGRTPVFSGEENGRGYLNNAARANALFGNPTVPLGLLIEWIAHWVSIGGASSGKPTHFETQNGKY
jgi:dTDP-4-dehydrorhamnose reductase